MSRCKECGCRHCQCPQVLTDRIEELEAELAEQCRLNGMGSERETRLMARVEELERAARMALEAFVITATYKQMKAITALRDALGEKE